MKPVLTLLLLILIQKGFSQPGIPLFLKGTWKADKSDLFEHWDLLNENTLKGFSYKMVDGQILISEYTDITRKENDIVYTATVLNQNKGKSIDFKLTGTGSTYTFENPDHDFPRKIVYQQLSDDEISVSISGGQQKEYRYTMMKQNSIPVRKDTSISNPDYDAALATRLGADDYGMKSYILVILKTGPNKTTDKAFISSSFRGHLDNINSLVKAQKLIIAGPMGKNDNNYRGIFILHNVSTLEEADALLKTDPAIAAELLEAELYKWYGSAALPEYLPFSDKIWKLNP